MQHGVYIDIITQYTFIHCSVFEFIGWT